MQSRPRVVMLLNSSAGALEHKVAQPCPTPWSGRLSTIRFSPRWDPSDARTCLRQPSGLRGG